MGSPAACAQRYAAGRRRSPATMPGYLAGRAPRNKGTEYPPDPPRPEEIVLVMRQAGHDRHGLRMRALIAVLWRGGLRISEALALNETDIDQARGSVLVRHGKGDKRREAGMDQFGFQQLAVWQTHRVLLPPGLLFCVIDGVTRGRRWSPTAARNELRHLAAAAGVRRRFAPTAYPEPRGLTPARCRPRDPWRRCHITRISNTPTSEPRRPTFRESTPARSSTPSAHADHPRSRRPPGSACSYLPADCRIAKGVTRCGSPHRSAPPATKQQQNKKT
jgi:hypothetical protein